MTLINLRQQIDHIDTEIIQLLAKRQDLSAEIGEIKKMNDLTVTDPAREEEALRMRRDFAAKHGLSEEEIKTVFQAIFEISKKRQS